ncbi:MAG: PA0069 family radical SAM protein [Betaproteobacteria bacterium]|nr:PA0069 family radical SAM protein [Betaproteobacteria bacterium]
MVPEQPILEASSGVDADPVFDSTLAPRPVKGRGTTARPDPRYAVWTRRREDDGWNHSVLPETPEKAEGGACPATQLLIDHAKTLINSVDSPDLPFDRSINPYRGCEHGCIYCYARPSHAWLGDSPGVDFETRIYHKPDALKLLRRELMKPGYCCRPIALSSNTDCYQPFERHLRLTRGLLEILCETRHPVLLTTKSTLIGRDTELLAAMARRNLAHVSISLTTLDPRLARLLEPRAASPAARLALIRQLSSAGIPVAVMAAPVIPALTDRELEEILAAAREAGAHAAWYSVLRLPEEVGALFESWLQWHFPEKAAHVLSLLRQMRDGGLDEKRFGLRMRGAGPFADMIRQRFRLAHRRLGFPGFPSLDCGQFTPPVASIRGTRGSEERQLNLF